MRTGTRHMYKSIVGGVMAACLAAPAAMVQAGPQWNVGDTWQVGAWQGQVFRPDKRAQTGVYKLHGRMVTATFEVTGTQPVGQADCYEVKVTLPKEETGFQRRCQAYYNKTTGRLLRIRDVSLLPDGSTKNLTRDYPADATGPTIVDDIPCLVPLDWPDPSRPDVAPQAAEPVTTAQSTTPQAVSSADGTVQQENEVTLTKSSAKREAKVVQSWRQGEPWWHAVRKYEDGQLSGEAVLLKINGKVVADAPQSGQ